MTTRIGFIGAGNMAQAIFRRLLAQRFVEPAFLHISDALPDLTQRLATELGLRASPNNPALVGEADVIILAVKPIYCAGVLREIRQALGEKPLLSIVTGWTLDMLQTELSTDAHLLRVMPNTPAMLGEGMTFLGTDHTLSDKEFSYAQDLFACVGDVQLVEDNLFNAATCISGCGPAFMYHVIEAMADAGVIHGLPRDVAYRAAAQTMVGAGKMVLEGSLHPAELKDAVCSPGGTTVMGMFELEKAGVRKAMLDAVSAAFQKTQQVSSLEKK